MKIDLKNIEIVLVRPKFAGNIGAVARIMKNMGLSNLVLIKPTMYRQLDAIRMSSGAEDIIDNSIVCDSLEDGVANSSIVFGTTCRSRALDKDVSDIEEFVKKTVPFLTDNKISILFGPENFGLSNDDLKCCKSYIHINTSIERTSLNLAQAVGLVCYEFSKTNYKFQTINKRKLIENRKKELLFNRFGKILGKVEFFREGNVDILISSMRNILEKTLMDEKEFRLVMGVLKKIEKKIGL